MKVTNPLFLIGLLIILQCNQPPPETSEKSEKIDYSSISRVENGTPVSVMLTCYSTTLLANGKDTTRLRVALTDSLSRQITSASDTIHMYINGNGRVLNEMGEALIHKTDSLENEYSICRFENGICHLLFVPGTEPGKVTVEARSGKLWPGSHEIHLIPAGFNRMHPEPDQLTPTEVDIDRMIGADISWLPQLEDRGMTFYDDGKEIDAIELLKKYGFNYIRLRIFVNPENDKGYAPGKGYCGLSYTLDMAKRVKEAGMKLLLDFHYSDYWADPQKQFQPLAWENIGFELLKDSLRSYTTRVLLTLQNQGTLPDMVQIGNEINHGILWPDGHISHPDQLAELLKAGVTGVEAVDPDLPVMMHIALGGQNKESVFWLDNMIARGVQFDVIGLSYYPRWHGTLEDLHRNMLDLLDRYNKPLNVVEYSDFKRTVHNIVFNLPDEMGKGACIWEPLGMQSRLFNKDGEVTELMKVYRELNERYMPGE